MDFDSDFWLATAAAAPVIALAAIVAVPDALGMSDEMLGVFDRINGLLETVHWGALETKTSADQSSAADLVENELRLAQAELTSDAKRLRVVPSIFTWVANGNVLIQTLLLGFSLAALGSGGDVVPQGLAIAAAVLGLFLLSVTVQATAEYRRMIRRMATPMREQLSAIEEMLRREAEGKWRRDDDI
jgi:hypothetical protein